jgi:hypothetical protein
MSAREVLPFYLRTISFASAAAAKSVEEDRAMQPWTTPGDKPGASVSSKRAAKEQWDLLTDGGGGGGLKATVAAAARRFGVIALLQRIHAGKTADNNPPSAEALAEQLLEAKFHADGTLNFTELFSKESMEPPADRPIKMEICAGSGEWVVAQVSAFLSSNPNLTLPVCQARGDAGGRWLAVELRHDRGSQIVQRAVCQAVSNLAVLCGDAREILPQRIAAASLAAVFVNHPEPPQQRPSAGGEQTFSSQSAHLLDAVPLSLFLSLSLSLPLALTRIEGVLLGGRTGSAARRTPHSGHGQPLVRAAPAEDSGGGSGRSASVRGRTRATASAIRPPPY